MLRKKMTTQLIIGFFVLGANAFAGADEVKNPQAQPKIQVEVQQQKTGAPSSEAIDKDAKKPAPVSVPAKSVTGPSTPVTK